MRKFLKRGISLKFCISFHTDVMVINRQFTRGGSRILCGVGTTLPAGGVKIQFCNFFKKKDKKTDSEEWRAGDFVKMFRE